MTETWVGRTLSKVQIQQLIGRGGMADVYVGLHTTLNVPRAVKILHGHLTEDPDLQRRFLDEAKSVAALRHPNIVQVYDFDLVDGSPYIIMELLQGLPMSAYLKGLHQLGHSLTLDTVARLLDRIASALDYAHTQGIVHRDVKPANVILRQGATPLNPSIPLPPDSEPVLTDFGIARISGATTQTLTGTILGTPAYMSPEQVRGVAVDARSDNYSLGIMLYEMLAGVLPFDPEIDTTASVLYKQANVPPPPLANTSPQIQAVVDRALQKDREARFQKASDLAVAFRDVNRAGPPTLVAQTDRGSPPAAPATAPAARTFRLRPLWIGVAAAAAVLLCIGAIGLGALSVGSLAPSATSPATSAPIVEPTQAQAVVDNATATSPAGPLAGGSIYQDSSMQAVIHNAPDPGADSAYAAWLIGPEGASQLAGADFSQGTISIAFVDPQGRNLLAVYDEFAVSVEPNPDPAPDVPGTIHYLSQAPPDVMVEIRRLDSSSGGAPTSQSLVAGLRSESGTHDSHLGFSLTAVDGGNLTAAKVHGEHTINILVGEASEDYGDWDQSGRPENPGDGFGLIPYLRLGLAMAQSELDNPDASEQALASLRLLIGELEGAIRLAEDSADVAKRMVAVDTIDEIRPLAEEWSTMLLAEASARAALQIEEFGLRLWTPISAAP